MRATDMFSNTKRAIDIVKCAVGIVAYLSEVCCVHYEFSGDCFNPTIHVHEHADIVLTS